MQKYEFNKHQLRLWNQMINFIVAYKQDETDLPKLVGGLEGALDAGEFKNQELKTQWYKFWGPLEVYHAKKLDEGEPFIKEDIIDHVELMYDFLLKQLVLQRK